MYSANNLHKWISILVSHIYFVNARNAQGVDPKTLAYRAPFGKWGSHFALFWCIIIALTKNFSAFTKGSYGAFDYKNFITGYLGIPLYLIMIFGYKLIYKSKGATPENADIWSGKGMSSFLSIFFQFGKKMEQYTIDLTLTHISRRLRQGRADVEGEGG